MPRLSLLIMLLSAASVLIGGCDYARMSDQESIRTYEASMPEMPQGAIPVQGGIQIYREMDPEEITNPLPFEGAIVELGQRGYGYFCVMCHGPKLDGNATVGQSFYPLPTHLKRAYVQKQPDGVLFYKVSFGYKRHPYLADTVSEDYRWAIIHYLRSLVKSKASKGFKHEAAVILR